MVPKKLIRSNKEQIKYLCRYMNANPQFAAGDFRTPLGAANMNHEWAKLKEALDQLGPNRSIEQWKICWRDQKRKARAEGGALNQVLTETGNTAIIPDLSDNTSLVLGTIGTAMAVGIGPEESPIGNVPEQPPTLVETSASTSASSRKRPLTSIPKQTRRARRTLPSTDFLNAQIELNNLIRELVNEVRRVGNLLESFIK